MSLHFICGRSSILLEVVDHLQCLSVEFIHIFPCYSCTHSLNQTTFSPGEQPTDDVESFFKLF